MAFFDDMRLPDDVERGMNGGPGTKTNIRTRISGREKRNRVWAATRGRWSVSYGISTKPQLDAVIDMFYIVGGEADGFRFKDWSEFQIGDTLTPDVSTRQLIGLTDTTTTTFQIFLRKAQGANFFDRIISKIVVGTLRVWVDNVEITEGAGVSEYAIDNNTGIITLGSTLVAQSGTEVEVLCEFDVPVRFNQADLDLNTEGVFGLDAVLSIPSIQIIEIRI